ncbi:structural maintenance of chromosomes protein 5 [Marchantia polymorpha subsp. ruderalis]
MTVPSTSRPAKRAKTASRGQDDYAPGNIIEIELHNFMTYGHIKSKPGPRLNLVIGPNGTGKSSLVCAICIGLAGEPQLLGRAGQIGDFVKRGEESGWTKISLRGNSDDEVVVITRKINSRNKSDWLLNDRSVSKKDVQDVVQGFNIQLNNLTQFLPQDRVCEFAKLTPIELLGETEKAVGDPELSAQHQRLKVLSEDLKMLQTTVSQLESSLAQNKASNRELEEDGQRMRQRNELLEKAASLRKKLPWLKYDEKKAAYQAAKEAENLSKNTLRDAQNRQQELQAPYQVLKRKKQTAEEASKKLLAFKSASETKMRQLADLESEMASQARSYLLEIEEVHKRESQRQEKIERAQREVALAEAELARLPEYEAPTSQIQEIANKIRSLQMESLEMKNSRLEKDSQLGQLRNSHEQCIRRLKDISSVNTRLLQQLQKAGAHGIFEAYQWVQTQREQNMFKSDVYGPVLLEVQIPDKANAAYIENHVPGHIWKSFITLNEEDRDFCVRNLKQHGCPVINQRDIQRPSALPLTNEMRQLGIVMRLDEAIFAPEVVKQVLNGQAVLDHSFIGNSEANLRADEAPKLGVGDLWTPENHYRWQRSRYGGHVSASVGAVRPVRLFSENIDVREKNNLEQRKAELEEAIKQSEEEIKFYGAKLRDLEVDQAKLHREREELYNQVKMEKKKRQDVVNLVEQRKKKLRMFENEESSAIAEAKLRESVREINAQRCQNVLKLKEVMVAAVEKQIQYAAHHLNVIELDAKLKELEKDLKTQEDALDELQRHYDLLKSTTESARQALQTAKGDAEKVASLTSSLQAEFRKMPDSVEELEEAISEAVDAANAVICNNPNVLEEYERRCKQIQGLTEKVDNQRTNLERCMKEIETTKDLWLPRLRDLVSRINETFSRNFMEMAVAGEVSLDEHGTDFDKYGVLIKVKFRETAELQVLSAHHQSGGERSVSTILYLVSLQDLTYCPFRVVDEINQGMDPNNERKMFQQLVRAASQPNTPQCLLLTPKLLPDLDYTDACTVLNIMNGPWLEEASTEVKKMYKHMSTD